MDMLSESGGGIIEALNATVHGNGTRTVVLSHGFGFDQSVWHYLIPYLACYFKVVVFDLIFVNPNLYDPKKYSNFDSYAQDLVCLLDQLNVKKTVYLGHSMSAMIGCIAATKRPDLFEHLILLGGSPRYLNAEGYYGGFERSDIDKIFEAINENFPVWVQNFVPMAVGINNSAAIAEFEYSLGRMKPEIVLSVAKTVFLSDLRLVLPQVKVPCTIIQSREDIVAPTFIACYMKENLGGDATVKILETQGHFPQLTAFPLLLDALNKVLSIP
ncbi:strigolactone esterase D14-like [Vitis riparia]|uniref:strigolactone esterase D14-like n=1 Tax=Vitis riparia TaxID=96939 RepID=UPI00155B10BE|nr:strigolactone esterase D14-like [Vitis riparia]XP_034692695.1 strigolactone esterase D14-like [Vitis riparia]XP_034692696.1 strigolactone esterase D14-like [Vitis riparia]